MDLSSVLNTADNISDPLDFPAKHEHMRTLDATLRCPICKDLYNSPVLLATCGHSYCSFCIRDSLRESERKECPTCRTPLQESNLKKNIALEEGVEAYKAARQSILLLATSSRTSGKRSRSESPVEGPTAGPSKRRRQSSNNNTSDDFSRADADFSDVEIIEASAAVQCPICEQQVKMSLLDSHIEHGCPAEVPVRDQTEGKKEWAKLLGGPGKASKKVNGKSKPTPKSAKGRPSPPSVPLRPLAKVSYYTLSAKRIRSLLQEQCLSTDGDRAQWEQRHAQWITLYNANLDSSTPKPIDALRKDLERMENVRARDEKDKKIRESRVSAQGYEESQKQQFATLVQQAKATVCKPVEGISGAESMSTRGSTSGQPIAISSDIENEL